MVGLELCVDNVLRKFCPRRDHEGDVVLEVGDRRWGAQVTIPTSVSILAGWLCVLVPLRYVILCSSILGKFQVISPKFSVGPVRCDSLVTVVGNVVGFLKTSGILDHGAQFLDQLKRPCNTK